jgi:hypothetical protein
MLTAKLAFCWAIEVILLQLIDPERWQLGMIDGFTKTFNTEAIIEHITDNK